MQQANIKWPIHIFHTQNVRHLGFSQHECMRPFTTVTLTLDPVSTGVREPLVAVQTGGVFLVDFCFIFLVYFSSEFFAAAVIVIE